MKILERDELVRLIFAVRAGDNEAFEVILNHYKPLIISIVSRLSSTADEYFSEACVALYTAVMTYKVEQEDVTFGLYARILITRRVNALYRKNKSDNDRISPFDDEDIAVSDGIVTRLESEEESAKLRDEARNLLSKFEYEVFLLWLDGYKTSDIAKKLKRGVKSIDNAKARILKKLRDGLSPRHR